MAYAGVISELGPRNIFGSQGKEVPEIARTLWNPKFYVHVHNAGSGEQGSVPLSCIKCGEFLF
jgi:hypothetical protein